MKKIKIFFRLFLLGISLTFFACQADSAKSGNIQQKEMTKELQDFQFAVKNLNQSKSGSAENKSSEQIFENPRYNELLKVSKKLLISNGIYDKNLKIENQEEANKIIEQAIELHFNKTEGKLK